MLLVRVGEHLSASEDQTSKLLKVVNSKTEAELRSELTGKGTKLEHKSHKKQQTKPESLYEAKT